MPRTYLPVEDLKVRGVYELYSRNIFWGVFDGDGFVGLREKFGNWLIDKEYLGHTVQGAMQYICDLPEPITMEQTFFRKDHPWIAEGFCKSNDLLMGYLLRIQETIEQTE